MTFRVHYLLPENSQCGKGGSTHPRYEYGLELITLKLWCAGATHIVCDVFDKYRCVCCMLSSCAALYSRYISLGFFK